MKRIAAVVLMLIAASAAAQEFPAKQVRLISPFPSGSGPDVMSRLLADKLSRYWNQTVIVEARPGGNGVIAIEAMKSGAKDGHDLVVVDNGHVTINPSLFKKLSYNVERDLAPAALIFRTPFFIAVSAAGPIKSVPDLIAAAKAKPGTVSYGTPFVGSPSHLGSALFESQTGTQMIHVPFKETAQLFNSIGTGEVTWGLGTLATTGPMVRAGKVRLIAVAAPARLTTHADIPTVAEAGGPAGYEVNGWVAFMGPRAAPVANLEKINRDVNRALNEVDVRDKFSAVGFQPLPDSRDALVKLLESDSKKYAELVKRTGASID
jgi:tripartite-type tricarboxylate transporter receptor subunit TctC